MPKKLDNIREKALIYTRGILEQQGYEALAMRDVAKSCGVAVGTMYNYFPSKEYLTGCVVLEDWQQTYREMTLLIGCTETLNRGLQEIYGKMLAFVQAHQYLMGYDRRKPNEQYDFSNQHILLRRQVEELLQLLQTRFRCGTTPDITAFLAESILNCSVRQFEYPQIESAFLKLLK